MKLIETDEHHDTQKHAQLHNINIIEYSSSVERCEKRKEREYQKPLDKDEIDRFGKQIKRTKTSNRRFCDLPLEWWERSPNCKRAKERHTKKLDYHCESREDLVLATTLWNRRTVLEPNMFPYATPRGIKHYTLWSVDDMTHEEIVRYVDGWLQRRMPHVRRWQYDDNSGERSVLLFHVHVFIETDPYCFTPRHGMEYFPPHVKELDDYEDKSDY